MAMFASLFEGPAAWFTVCGLLGTGMFVMRLSMAALGGHGGHAGDAFSGGHDFGHLGHVGHSGGGHAGHDASHTQADGKDQSTQTFSLLSLQSIVGFLMGFGWGGIAGLKGFGWPWWQAAMGGVVCGAFMVYLLAITLRAVYSLASSGNVEVWEAVGSEGEVYSNVPVAGDGMGKVKLVVSSRLRTLNAVAAGEALHTKTRVRVVKVNPDNTVTVTRV
ncbi:MAG: hypothetical protein WC718_03615 [Phycisphaerales bacterium]|jgi:hypothetical protein